MAVPSAVAATKSVEGYQFDGFNDGNMEARATEGQAKAMTRYVREFMDELWEVEDAISETLPRSMSSHPMSDPIALDLMPREQTSLLQLAQTSSKSINKLVSIFSFLICELKELRKIAETKFFAPIALFGAQTEDAEMDDGHMEIAVGRMMPLFTELTNYLSRVRVVVCNTIQQLASLFDKKQKIYASFSSGRCHFLPLYEALAETFESLFSLQQIISTNSDLTQAWDKYEMMLKAVLMDPPRFGTDADQAQRLDMLYKSIDSVLFNGTIFDACIEQAFDYQDIVTVLENDRFARESIEMIMILFRRSLKGILTPEGVEYDHQQQLAGEIGAIPGLFGLLALHARIFKNPRIDKKFCKDFVDLARAIPIIPLWGKGIFYPLDFIVEYLDGPLRGTGIRLGQPNTPDGPIIRYKRDYLASVMKRFRKWAQEYTTYVTVWMSRVESNMISRTEFSSSIDIRIRMIREGFFLANQIRSMFTKVVTMHSALSARLELKDVLTLCDLIVLIKSIETTFRRKMACFGEITSVMCQRVCRTILSIVEPVRSVLQKKSSKPGSAMPADDLDLLAALTMSVSMLRGCTTLERRTILRISLAMATGHSHGINGENEEKLIRALQQLDAVSDISANLKVCDTFYLYWNREIVPFMFANVFSHPEHNIHSIQPMLDALSDIGPYMETTLHLATPEDGENLVLSRYRDEVINKFLKPKIIDPLQRKIDEDLRLQTHLHLDVADKNGMHGVCAFRRFLTLPPLTFLGVSIDLKSECGDFLDRTFYNTNTVALFDWKTYEEMRFMGRSKYGLPLVDAFLPSGTLEQGLDVLEVMRNIHVFVGKYHYNMNNQFFIEHQSESKTLNTIGISTIANSIRTHGTGIMNTTVNFTYQYLRTMFDSFSQFLFDEHIKSPLTKEVRYFHELQVEAGDKVKTGSISKSFYQYYPFDRADRFNKEIRKLGTTSEGGGPSLTFLDRFRILVTQIGNAMGYIRMVRSGGLLAVANAIKYVPVLSLEDGVTKFGPLVEKDGLSVESVAAGSNLDMSLENLTQSFVGQGFEYFKLLVDVFAPEFQAADATHHHLSNFYIIIPALTLNYVEYLLTAKDRVIKKSSQLYSATEGGFVFCDDGFAIGIAYILKLLDQTQQFDALHWFDSVRTHYMEAMRKIDEQAADDKRKGRGSKKEKEEQAQTTVLNKRKLAMYLREFDLLKFSFAGAKIFFDN